MSSLDKSTVKWFDSRKGYGFLVGIEKSDHQDIFVHYTEIENGDLSEGDSVTFELVNGKKGPSAKNLEIVAIAS